MLTKMRNTLKGNKGFTMIELVIVIAIIGILAAIAVPRFTQSAASARGAKMQADLRTIDSAIAIALANGGAAPVGAVAAAANVVANLASVPAPPAGAYSTALHANDNVAAGIQYQINAAGRATVTTTAGTFTADGL